MNKQSDEEKNYRKALTILFETYGRTYETKQKVFAEGDPGKEVFFIVSGAVTVYLGSGSKRRNLWTLWAGDIFGEMALLDQLERTASIEAALQTKVVVMERDLFNQLIGKYPIVAQKVIELMGKRMRQMDSRSKQESGYTQEATEGQTFMPSYGPPPELASNPLN